jgi:energy-coupling factor transporter ATP-binding protein EcfA2
MRTLIFLFWLKSQQNTFCVTGAAGSGKSTLMKYLASSDKVHDMLRQWAYDQRLVFAIYCFWHNGSKLQKI